jgi:polyferredoxin
MLLGMSMLTLILPPTLLSIEGLASAYTRSLPIRKRTIIKAKTITTIIIYLISLTVLFITSILLGRGFYSILTFGTIYTFSIAAACMLELSIFVGKFWKEEFALGNIYARFGEFIKVIIPGLLTALAPITVAFTAYFTAKNLVLTLFSATAFLEFATMMFIVSRST